MIFFPFSHFGVNQPFCYVVCEHLHNVDEGASYLSLFCYRPVSLVNIYFKLILTLFQVLSNYPKESVPEMHLKITALELLKGKRAEWGIQR